jgi:adenylate cyclase
VEPGDIETNIDSTYAVVMFADIVESVALIETDEIGAIRRIRALFLEFANTLYPRFHATQIERRGDGLLLTFKSVRNAVQCAHAMHGLCADEQRQHLSLTPIAMRIGVHASTVFSDGQSLFGKALNHAARISSLANPGETTLSELARDQIIDGIDSHIEDLGECYVRSIDRPIRAFRAANDSLIPQVKLDQKSISAMETRPSLAVIPFQSASENIEHRVLGDLIADSVTAQLRASTSMRIVSTLSTRAFTGQAMSAQEIAQKLGAAYVVCGRVSVVGDALVIYVEVIRADANSILWADQVSTRLSEVTSPGAEVSNQIALNTQSTILEYEIKLIEHTPLPNLKSYSMFLGGLSLMHRQTRSDFERAHGFFTALKERHPRTALPRAWLGHWHMLRVAQSWAKDAKAETRLGLYEVERALEMEPNNSFCLTVKGVIHAYLHKDFEKASRFYEMARQHNPNDPLAHLQSAALHGWTGDGSAAKHFAEEALRLSPLDPQMYFFHSLTAGAMLGAGEYEQAALHAAKSLRANRLHVATHKVHAMALGMLGRGEESRAAVKNVLALTSDFTLSQFTERSPWRLHPCFNDFAKTLIEAGAPA